MSEKNSIDQIYDEYKDYYTEGKNSSKDSRGGADVVYRVLLVGGLITVGLVLLVLSVFVHAMKDWMVGGIIFLLFGILLLTISNKVEK